VGGGGAVVWVVRVGGEIVEVTCPTGLVAVT
jgi:hypothetical protein